MSVKGRIARIAGEPDAQEIAAAVCIAALVGDVRDTMRAVRVLLVEFYGPFDFRTRLRDAAILAERNRVIGKEPVIVAVMRGKTVEQLCVPPLLSHASRTADETVWIAGRCDHHRIARPLIEMGIQGVDGGVPLA